MSRDRIRLLGGTPLIPRVCEGPGIPGMVSVLIPTYNRAYILGQALDSVLAQTYRNIEVVVVDDGSTDGTRALLEKYGDRIRYIHQRNAGLAAARNTGLQAARGEFVAFQDSDDIWAPWKLEAQIAVLQRFPEVAICWTDMKGVNPRGETLHESAIAACYHVYEKIDLEREMPEQGTIDGLTPDCSPELRGMKFRHGDIYAAMFLGNLVHPPTAVMRSSAVAQVGGLDLCFGWTCEDYEFFWRVASVGHGAFVQGPGMLYRLGSDDQLSRPNLHLYIALGNEVALSRAVHRDRKRIESHWPQIRDHLANAHVWVANEEFSAPDGRLIHGLLSMSRALVRDPRKARQILPALLRRLLPAFVMGSLVRLKRTLTT